MLTRLVITIDTEPDDQWATPGNGASTLSFANTRGLGRLIAFLRERGLKATWLTSYSVAHDRTSARVLRDAAAEGDEIGGHLHGWETPPFTSDDSRAHPYLYEYDPDIQRAKLRNMTHALEDAFDSRPASYRAGRWGIDERGLELLAEAGYEIDTSIVPGETFRASKGVLRGGPDFRPYLRGVPPAPFRMGSIWEVPASTTLVGALGDGALPATVARALNRRTDLPSRLMWKAIDVGGAMRLVWVRPLAHARADLVRASLRLLARGASVINVMFHSSEAFAGTSPRTRDAGAVERFYGDMDALVTTLMSTGRVAPCTLADAVAFTAKTRA